MLTPARSATRGGEALGPDLRQNLSGRLQDGRNEVAGAGLPGLFSLGNTETWTVSHGAGLGTRIARVRARPYSAFCSDERQDGKQQTMSRQISTLAEPPVSTVLDSLFAQAEASSPLTAIADLSPDERARLMGSKTGYRDFYGRLKDMPLAVSRETGRLLYLLARGCRARTIVEFGTSFGLSTLHLAAALRDNGGGRLITCEFEPSKVVRAQANLTAAGLADLVEFRGRVS